MQNLNINIYNDMTVLSIAKQIKLKVLMAIENKELYNKVLNIESANRIIFLFGEIYKSNDKKTIEIETERIIKKWQ
jgi:hypothetical protein